MADFKEVIKNLTKQLYPTGRVFKMPDDSVFESMIDGLILSENRFHKDARGVLYSILPDNPNFTADDATRWEILLGLIVNELTPLEDRKLAILRKLNHPGTVKARQSRDYIENSLRLAGFDIYVYENPDQLTIEQILAFEPNLTQLGDSQLGDSQLGDVYSYFEDEFVFNQLGDGQLGDFQLGFATFTNKIVNHIDETKDYYYINFAETTFIIGGPTFGSFATVDVNRKDEFRQLILKLKPVHNAGYLLINYI